MRHVSTRILKSVCAALFPTAFFLLAAASTPIQAAPILIYDGTTLPASQGWQRSANGSASEAVQGGGLTQFTTTTLNGAQTSATQLYAYTTTASNFIASIRLRAISVNPHNTLDAGLMFALPDGNFGTFGNTSQRARMLAIDPTRIVWTDDSGGALVDTTQFHEYAIRYRNGRLDVYVDASFPAIAAGTATPVLSRVDAAYASPGRIIFGDQTNDPNVDSNYIVDFVRFQDLDVIDPPAAGSVQSIPTLNEWALLLLSGLIGVAAMAAAGKRR